MSRLREATDYAAFALEAGILECFNDGQPVSAFGILGVMSDIRLMKAGLLPKEEIMNGGAMSKGVIAQRVKVRFGL